MLSCLLCEGPLMLLGDLGGLGWFRCRDCGMEFSRPCENLDEDDPLVEDES